MKMEIIDTENLKKEIETDVKPQEKQVQEITKLAKENTEEIMTLDLENFEEKRKMLKSIDEFAIETMQNSSRKNSCFFKLTVVFGINALIEPKPSNEISLYDLLLVFKL